MKADYEVNWDKDRMFQNSRSHTQETSRMSKMAAGNYRSEAPRRQQQISRSSPDDARRKRFKVRNQVLQLHSTPLAVNLYFRHQNEFGSPAKPEFDY